MYCFLADARNVAEEGFDPSQSAGLSLANSPTPVATASGGTTQLAADVWQTMKGIMTIHHLRMMTTLMMRRWPLVRGKGGDRKVVITPPVGVFRLLCLRTAAQQILSCFKYVYLYVSRFLLWLVD